ncbi:transposase, partial [Phytobacter sp. V91]|uniref:transposase n=1 Tax=Phytobacter sp. V91 TaxID=3369425 RepID=UPI003F5F5EA8
AYLEGGNSLTSTARQFGCPEPSLRAWVSAYGFHGEAALQPSRRSYSNDFRLQVVQTMQREHLSVRMTAARFNIPDHKTVSCWVRRAASGQLTPDSQENKHMPHKPPHRDKPPEEMTPEQLVDEVLYLRAEKAYLEKLDALMKEKAQKGKKKPSSSGR